MFTRVRGTFEHGPRYHAHAIIGDVLCFCYRRFEGAASRTGAWPTKALSLARGTNWAYAGAATSGSLGFDTG